MDPIKLELLAEDLYKRARLDPTTSASTVRLARVLLGDTAIELVPRHALRTPAMLARVGERWRIFVRRPITPQDLAFLCGHELAHWALRREGYHEPDEEAAADYLGACLVAPRRAFLSALRDRNEDLSELARVFVATESLCALRTGETTGRVLALVSPSLVRVRGLRPFEWGDEATIRRLARRGGPGLARTRLRDDPRRVVLTAEDLDAVDELPPPSVAYR